MAFSISFAPKYPCPIRPSVTSFPQKNHNKFLHVITRCEVSEESSRVTNSFANNNNNKGTLGIGSPIVIVDAPQMIKTAASVPCLRVNDGLVRPGDVGRIVSRKPMDVWAVRLRIGTYLIDGKYFKPLEIDD